MRSGESGRVRQTRSFGLRERLASATTDAVADQPKPAEQQTVIRGPYC